MMTTEQKLQKLREALRDILREALHHIRYDHSALDYGGPSICWCERCGASYSEDGWPDTCIPLRPSTSDEGTPTINITGNIMTDEFVLEEVMPAIRRAADSVAPQEGKAPPAAKAIYVLWNDYSDHSAMEIVRAYTDKTRAEQDYELAQKDSLKVWRLTCVKVVA